METRRMSFYALIPTPVVLMALLVICLSGCGDVMIGPYDLTSYPTPPATIPEMIDTAQSPDYEVRVSAISALGNLGPEAEPAVPTLVAALSDSVSEVRAMAAYALGDIGPVAATAVPELVKTLQADGAGHVRTAAAAALGQLDDTSAVPVLAGILYEENAGLSLQIRAAQSLAYLTENTFTDSEPGPQGLSLADDGKPLLLLDARDWWENEGQYQEWPDTDM
jgi:hypothetical protein